MAKLNVNIGLSVNDKTGDTLRTAFDKINQNFTELYAGGAGGVPSQTDNSGKYLTTNGTVLSWATVTSGTTSYTDLTNKPTLFSGSYTDLTNKPSIPVAQIQSDWTQATNTALDFIKNKPALFSGSYTDLTNKPTIPTSFSSLVNGAHQLVLGVSSTTPYVTFPAVAGGSIIIQGSEIAGFGSGSASIAILTSAESDVRLSANAAGTRKNWTFGTDGSLTFPNATVQTTAYPGPLTPADGDTTSGSANLVFYDGSWKYTSKVGINPASGMLTLSGTGGAGGITFPDNTVQTTAWTGSVSRLVNGSKTVSLDTTGRLVNLQGVTLTAGGQVNICTIFTTGSGYNTGSALKATTGGSGTGMTVGIGYGLSNQLASVTVVNPGTGYVDNDVITVSEGTEGRFILTQYNELGNQDNGNFVQSNWAFGTDGATTFPTATVNLHNGGVQSAQVLQFGDKTQQAIITGPTPAPGANAQRIIIQGQRGTSADGGGEGGDVYVWGGDSDVNGGDIKIYAGDADGDTTGQGGYVNVEAGRGFNTGGYLGLSAGNSTGGAGSYGGSVNIRAGQAYDGYPGAITLSTFTAAGSSYNWNFTPVGELLLPSGGTITEGGGISGAIKLKPAGGANDNQALLIYPTAGAPEGDHIHLTAGGGSTDLYLGSDLQYVKIDHGGSVFVGVSNGIPNGVANWNGQGGWNQGLYSNLATTGGTGTGLTVNVAAGGGGYINIGTITIANPGSGYTNGDVITINNENNLPGTFTITVYNVPAIWQYGTTGGLTLPNAAVIGQASDVEITAASTAYTNSLTTWESVRASYQAQANGLGITSAGWPFITWIATGTTAAGFLSQLTTAWQVQQSPSSPPTPLIFQPAISAATYNEIRTALAMVRDSYTTWQALLTSVEITSGSESLTLLSNGKLVVPGIIQTLHEEDITIRTRYLLASSAGGNPFDIASDFVFGTNGSLTLPIGIANTTGNLSITPQSAVSSKFFNFFVASTVGTFNNASLAMPIAENNKSVNAEFSHADGTIGYLWNQGTDSNVTNLNNAFNMFANGTDIKLTAQDGSGNQFTWKFAKDGNLTVSGSIIGTATQNVFNTTSTTVNAFGAATTLNIGASGGTTTIAGNLTINGTITTINSTTLTVDDKNIELGSVASPTNTTADGGGITLKGATDKTIIWDNANSNWTASEHWNIASGKTYKINNVDVLTATAVLNDASQTSVTIAGSATTLNIGASGGTTTIAGNLTASQLTIVNNRISTSVSDANLELIPNGVGGVVINNVAEATASSTTRSVGYLGLPPANSSITRTLTIADSGKHTYITVAGVTLTIPANSSVAYPIGTTLTFIAGPSSTSVSIAITTDTMRLAGGTLTGTRTLAANGMATAVKVAATTWYINGTGLT